MSQLRGRERLQLDGARRCGAAALQRMRTHADDTQSQRAEQPLSVVPAGTRQATLSVHSGRARLPVASRAQDPEHGLSFEFLAAVDREPVMTGHAHGQITVNLAEADDAYRERLRTEVHELYRTPLGHMRHQTGRLSAPTGSSRSRACFGDERADYAAARWAESYISAYAR